MTTQEGYWWRIQELLNPETLQFLKNWPTTSAMEEHSF